jgi:hypothetical protein
MPCLLCLTSSLPDKYAPCMCFFTFNWDGHALKHPSSKSRHRSLMSSVFESSSSICPNSMDMSYKTRIHFGPKYIHIYMWLLYMGSALLLFETSPCVHGGNKHSGSKLGSSTSCSLLTRVPPNYIQFFCSSSKSNRGGDIFKCPGLQNQSKCLLAPNMSWLK